MRFAARAFWTVPTPRFYRYILDLLARTGEDGAKNIAWAALSDTSATPGAYVSVSSVREYVFSSPRR